MWGSFGMVRTLGRCICAPDSSNVFVLAHYLRTRATPKTRPIYWPNLNSQGVGGIGVPTIISSCSRSCCCDRYRGKRCSRPSCAAVPCCYRAPTYPYLGVVRLKLSAAPLFPTFARARMLSSTAPASEQFALDHSTWAWIQAKSCTTA